MRFVFVLIALVLAVPVRAQYPILFADYFAVDAMDAYVRECHTGVTGAATWDVADGVLQATFASDGVCFAKVADATWDIEWVEFSYQSALGAATGVTVEGANGSVTMSLTAVPGDKLRIRLDTVEHAVTTEFTYVPGTWWHVLLRLGHPDAYVHLNGDIATPGVEIPASVSAAPFTEVRFWGEGAGTAGYDNIIVRGAGVSPDERVNWGGLKSAYR
jgi:hypothetical protein